MVGNIYYVEPCLQPVHFTHRPLMQGRKSLPQVCFDIGSDLRRLTRRLKARYTPTRGIRNLHYRSKHSTCHFGLERRRSGCINKVKKIQYTRRTLQVGTCEEMYKRSNRLVRHLSIPSLVSADPQACLQACSNVGSKVADAIHLMGKRKENNFRFT